MDIQKYTKSKQLSEWAEMVSTCRNSGKTISAWCAENDTNEKTYYYRQKKICDAVPDLSREAAIPVTHNNSSVHFTEITPAIRAEPASLD